MIEENEYLIYDTPKKRSLKAFIKNCYTSMMRGYYFFATKIYRVHRNFVPKYNVSVLAIFKNESPYFREWIEFHRIIGIDHFFLYDNNSEDNYQEILQPYIDAGLVTLMPWTKNQAQMECYNDGILRFRNESKWIAIIDIDEFIVPNKTDNIYDFLKGFEDRPAVIAYWKYFGSSGFMDRPKDTLVVEKFVVGWRKYADIGKCFYNTKYDFDATYKRNVALHHFMWANAKGHNLPPVNVFGKICLRDSHPIPRHADADNFPLQINHYFTKSYEEYIAKRSKGDVFYKDNPHTVDYFFEHEMPCQKGDYHAYKYLVKLKLAMRGNNGNG